jgi:ubiquinone/menaquinone biosynthesis C-methylase UbiE
MALSLDQARSVYNRVGRIQDWQAFYEDAATSRLVANAALAGEQTIFEFGCGTGRLAARLLGALPPTATYLGVDISPVMINLATRRLAAWKGQARVVLVDGSLPLPANDGFADRVFSTFVFDLLDLDYARAVLSDLRRILTPDGRLCIASLASGDRPFERVVSRTWMGLWRMAPQLVGGCRPIVMSELLKQDWQVVHRSRVHRFGLVIDVLVAAPGTCQS